MLPRFSNKDSKFSKHFNSSSSSSSSSSNNHINNSKIEIRRIFNKQLSIFDNIIMRNSCKPSKMDYLKD